MNKDLEKLFQQVIELSEKSTLCVNYSNDLVAMSFRVNEKLTLTEQSVYAMPA